MLARLIRLLLAAEVAAYAVLGAWLNLDRGWSASCVVALAVSLAFGIRFVLVALSLLWGALAGWPRAPEHRLGAGGVLALVLGEYRAMLLNNWFYLPFEKLAVRPELPLRPTDRLPVVLVHGYFSNRGYFRRLLPWLEAHGVGPIYAPNFPAAFTTIERYADALHERIEEIVRATGRPKVVLVCHSMGGLAARLYLCRHGPSRVARVVTLASPHNGTVLAPLGVGENARQMRRGSPFLRELAGAESGLPGCAGTSIYSLHDNMVAPQASSRLGWMKNVAIAGVGHIAVLLSEPFFRALLAELREAGAVVEAAPR